MSPWLWALVGVVALFIYVCMWRFTFVFIGEYWKIECRMERDNLWVGAFFASLFWPFYWPLCLAGKLGYKAGQKSVR